MNGLSNPSPRTHTRLANSATVGILQCSRCRWIDRGTTFGNPYYIGPNGTREEVILQYREWFQRRMQVDRQFEKDVRKLAGKILVCWCYPQPCHGDVIIEWLEENV